VSAPFRELFVELPLTVFSILQGAVEQAVKAAEASTATRAVPKKLSDMLRFALSESGARWLASHYRLQEIAFTRSADRPWIQVACGRWCGHFARAEIEEIAFLRGDGTAVDAIDLAVATARRSCCCMERPGVEP
jgi:hypothetical protein